MAQEKTENKDLNKDNVTKSKKSSYSKKKKNKKKYFKWYCLCSINI